MQWQDLLSALALVLVIEGSMPFIAPQRWREMMQTLLNNDSRTLRVFGGAMLLAGLVLLHFARA